MKTQVEKCPYCNGDCPNEPDDSPNLCDGFAGDVDNLCDEQIDFNLDD